MVPDISERLNSIVGSLIDVVLPAIDPGDAAALEQAQLIVASLHVIRSQIDFAHAFEVADNRSLIELIKALTTILRRPCPAQMADFAAALSRPATFTKDIRAANRLMRDMVATLVDEAAAAADPATFKQVAQAILASEELQIRRDRAFVAGTGFDVEAKTLVSIADSFSLTAVRSGDPG
jgi:hypothetical protein